METRNLTPQYQVEGELLNLHIDVDGELLTTQYGVKREHQTTIPLIEGGAKWIES